MERAKELLVIQANLGYETRTEPEQVAPVTIQEEARREELVANTTPEKERELGKERVF